jgi:benzoylformate decarboxylase
MDDWAQEADEDRAAQATRRQVQGRTAPDPDALAAVAQRLAGAASPVLVAGADIDAAGGWDRAVALAVKQRLPVWAPPAAGGSRIGFPEDHPQFMGTLPPAIGPVADTLTGHDLVLVVGSSVFSYYPYLPGPLLASGTELVLVTSDADEAARAPMGDAIVGDVALALERLLELVPAAGPESRPLPEPRPAPEATRGAPDADRLTGSQAMAALAAAWPQDGVAVVESPSATLALRNQLRLSRPGSYYTGASGGLGFGIAAAVGVALAQPERPVVCVLGEGSAQYGITALWSALAYRAPVTFVVLRNDEYSILKWFAALEQVGGAPGLELPGLDVAAVARGYGMRATEVAVPDTEAVVDAVREAVAAGEPRLVQVPVAPGMWLQ